MADYRVYTIGNDGNFINSERSPAITGATASEMIDHVPTRLRVIRHVHALRLPSRQRDVRAPGVAVDADAHGRERDPCCPRLSPPLSRMSSVFHAEIVDV